MQRRLYGALGWGLFATTLAMTLMWGVRPDIHSAMQLPLFWFKLALPAMAAIASLKIVERIGRPGMRLGQWPWLLLVLLLLLWGSALMSWAMADPGMRQERIIGDAWQECVLSIAVLALPLFIAALWVMKGMGPTRPAWAGATVGLLAGTGSAAIYALHCPQMALPFMALWYVMGMLIPAAIGYAIGKKCLRW